MSSLRYLPMLLVTCSCSVYSASLLTEDVTNGGSGSGSATGGKGSDMMPGAGRSSGGAGANGHGGESGDPTGGGTGAMGGMTGGGGTMGNGAGTGGSSGAPEGGSAMAGMAGMGGAPVVLGDSEMIDDMEDGNFSITPKPPRYGFWYVAGDATVGAKIPKIEDLVAPLMPARDTSTSAVHFTASGFKGWGASVGLTFTDASQKRTPYDFGDAAAISFWLRGSVTDNAKLKVQLPTSGTDPSGTLCGGSGQGQCLDHFSTMVPVTSDWKLVTIPLAILAQAGWGVPIDKFESNKVLGIEWSAGTSNLDIWIDDLALVHPKK